MDAAFSQIGPFLIAALVVFIVYRRFRRNFGQQMLRPVRMQVRIVVLLIVGALLLPMALRSGAFVAALLGGAASGVVLALWGASRTRYLKIDNQMYFVPHTYTGIAVSLLFLGRLVYRLLQVYSSAHASHGAGLDSADRALAPPGMLQSPLTVGLFFVLLGYYVCYYSMVLWKSKRVTAEELGAGPTAPIT